MNYVLSKQTAEHTYQVHLILILWLRIVFLQFESKVVWLDETFWGHDGVVVAEILVELGRLIRYEAVGFVAAEAVMTL